jgi:1-acyl-sn-glycerol-3-phosphate acyltransferase
MKTITDWMQWFNERWAPDPFIQRANQIALNENASGYDEFGAHRSWIVFFQCMFSPIYEHYFRVTSEGIDNLPASGPLIFVANHSGTLPLDGMMLYHDILRKSQPPRLPRTVADYFVAKLPFVNLSYSRVGVIIGARENVRGVLQNDGTLIVFPEGLPGIAKPFTKRYQLQGWREGHIELALEHRASIIPVAIIGPEEQMPLVARLPCPKFMKIPYIPLAPVILPLPVRYHIFYGPPVALERSGRGDDYQDPELVKRNAQRVKSKVEELITYGLSRRKGVF